MNIQVWIGTVSLSLISSSSPSLSDPTFSDQQSKQCYKQTNQIIKTRQTTRSNRLLPLSCGSRCDRRGTSALSPQLPVWLHTAPAFVSPQRLASWRLRTARARVCYVPPCLVTGRGAWPGDRTTSSTARFHARATVRKSGPGLDTPGESVPRSKGNTMSDEVRFTILLSILFFFVGQWRRDLKFLPSPRKKWKRQRNNHNIFISHLNHFFKAASRNEKKELRLNECTDIKTQLFTVKGAWKINPTYFCKWWEGWQIYIYKVIYGPILREGWRLCEERFVGSSCKLLLVY